MLVHRRVTPSIKFASTHLYTWVERGTVRVKCLAQEHNTVSPARAWTQTAHSGNEPTNREATVPPQREQVGSFFNAETKVMFEKSTAKSIKCNESVILDKVNKSALSTSSFFTKWIQFDLTQSGLVWLLTITGILWSIPIFLFSKSLHYMYW